MAKYIRCKHCGSILRATPVLSADLGKKPSRWHMVEECARDFADKIGDQFDLDIHKYDRDNMSEFEDKVNEAWEYANQDSQKDENSEMFASAVETMTSKFGYDQVAAEKFVIENWEDIADETGEQILYFEKY